MTNLHEVAIGLIPGVGSATTRQLISYCGSAENVFKEKKGRLLRIPGIGVTLAENILNHKQVLLLAEKELKRAQKENVKLLFYTQEEYPARLKQVSDAPTLLYYKGTADLNHLRIIGIVGTRHATDYGKEITSQIVQEMFPYQPLIVSGMAYGIDIAAHKACLQYNIPTLGVLAHGLDILYPSAHKEAARQMLTSGGLLTEYGFGKGPEPSWFPARNRIIAAMCDAIIVVEAALSGGALITADIANSYDREVLAVPGNIGRKFSEGCNKIIRNHEAHIYTGMPDLVELLKWNQKKEVFAPKKRLSEILEGDSFIIAEIMQQHSGDINIDELSWRSQLPIHHVAFLLLELEMKNLVKALPGKKFRLEV